MSGELLNPNSDNEGKERTQNSVNSAEFQPLEHPLELQPQLESELEDNDNVIEGDDGEEEDEEEEEDDDGVYRFSFEGEMDPLEFAEGDDSSGVQPYHHYQRLEHHYEALAARKRQFRALPPNSETPAKKLRMGETSGVSREEMMELMNFNMPRKSRKAKKRGRRKGSKSKVTPEISRKLGDANLNYALGRYEQAISILKEVIRLSPNLPDSYHTLGLIYDSMGDKRKSFSFYMLAAHLQPKDASLWKLLVSWSTDREQTSYCLSKAIKADPEDTKLRIHRALLFIELGEFQKAAEAYEQISRLCPNDIKSLLNAAELFRRCGQHERAVIMLEGYLKEHPNEPDPSVVDILVELKMEQNEHLKALETIERTRMYWVGKEISLHLSIKAGLCHAHLGNLEKAKVIFGLLQKDNHSDQIHLIEEVADSLMSLQHYVSALKYYMMLGGDDDKKNTSGHLDLKIAHCCLSVGNKAEATKYFYKAIHKLEDSVDARLTLSTLLLGVDKDDEAIAVLLPPSDSDSSFDSKSGTLKPWWLHGRIKLNLCKIYKSKGLVEEFVNAIFPVISQTLRLATRNPKEHTKKRLTISDLSERIKAVGECEGATVFHRFPSLAPKSDVLRRANYAIKRMKKFEIRRKAERAAALADGIDWNSDDPEDESPPVRQELPLPNLLKEEEFHLLIIDVCKALSSLQRYWEALEVINLTLQLASNTLSTEMKQDLRTLGAQIAYNISDPTHGLEYARCIVNQHPDSYAAWNCYYKVVSRLDTRHAKHNKFLHSTRTKHKHCVPPILIAGHQFTSISQHQAAAREYLEAYKLMPDNALVNLCAGTAFINLALGFRLQNKHQCVLQGLAFLFNNLRLCVNSQEALFNIARAYHHIGMITLAVKYYEKVLAIHQDDYPIPKLPNENPDDVENRRPGYCDLRREASYNLQQIYLKSGATDLARQVTKDYCTL